MKRSLTALLCWVAAAAAGQLRPPAYPLITHDPYLSVWSFTDQLNASPTVHWTGKPQNLDGLLRVDGTTYRFLGGEVPRYAPVLPTALKQPYTARFTAEKPAEGWFRPDFDDSDWKTGAAPYGNNQQNPMKPGTHWDGAIWLRRSFELSEVPAGPLRLELSHDDDVVVYLNGEPVYDSGEAYIGDYRFYDIPEKALNTLHKGRNVLALYCVSPRGGSYLDAGLVRPLPPAVSVQQARQQNVTVTATQTTCTFACGPVNLKVGFCSPLLADDLETLSRPVSYVTFTATPTDGQTHDVQVFFAASGRLAADQPTQTVAARFHEAGGLLVQQIGTESQQILGKKGDDRRIDWGYACLAVPKTAGAMAYSGPADALKNAFVSGKKEDNSATGPLPAAEAALGLALPLKAGQPAHLLLGYDDVYAVEYFGQKLRGWWRRDPAMTLDKALETAENQYESILKKCEAFDKKIYDDALKAGGKPYAELCQLAYRQALAAHKAVVAPDGQLFFFSKENYSNGSIGTVDITYPSAPLFLVYNPELLKGMMRFIFDYSASGRWKKPFAAHDVGTYPLANGQTYGEDMPVEETGNMLILTGALAAVENNAEFARQHWETLTMWANYLRQAGFDPANQLCTDDFAGHLARNVNLSAKAIVGLEAYARLAELLGKKELADRTWAEARQMAARWQQMAADGDHYALTFDKPAGSWSQKYNLVWDKILHYNVFPKEVREKEIRFYLPRQQLYGLPLDSRKTYTKSDWIIWTATMAENPADFQALVGPLWKYANETTTRVPLSDWHETTTGRQVGFQARSVVGGYWMKVLADRLRDKK